LIERWISAGQVVLLYSRPDRDELKYLGMHNIKENYYKLKRRPTPRLLPHLTVCELHRAWKSGRCDPELGYSNALVSDVCFWPSFGLRTRHPHLATTVRVNRGINMPLPWFSRAT
jgi:hypothetical protein